MKNSPTWKKLFIYDFFAGEGSDIVGNYGSPLIILDEIRNYCRTIQEKKIQVKIVLNEYNSKKTERLMRSCSEYLANCRETTQDSSLTCNEDKNCVFHLVYENQDFQDFFSSIYSTMQSLSDYPRFIFLDQYGVRHVTKEVFSKILALDRTDFIFFISSSYVHRFVKNPEFQKYIDLERRDFDGKNLFQCHRVLFDY